MICEHGLDLLKQLLPPRIEVLRAGQTVEMSGLDSVDQLDRLSACGDQVEPSPRNHQAVQGRDRRWDRGDDDRKTTSRRYCARAGRPEWRKGPWANKYSKQL